MTSRLLSVITLSLTMMVACTSNHPQRIIFDTDLGNDVDDAMALDLLNKYVDDGTIDLLATMTNKASDYTPMLVDILNTFYGHPDIPIGKVVDGKTVDNSLEFEEKVCKLTIGGGKPMFTPTAKSADAYQEATSLYRKILSKQPDNSVTIVSVGYLTNVGRLLESGPDKWSKLTGVELVKKKVKMVSLMGGEFSSSGMEFNILCDLDASKKFVELCPVPVVVSPAELGMAIKYPCSSILGDFDWGVNHPMVESYVRYVPMPYDKETFDLTSVLYAVEPDFFTVSEPGKLVIAEGGQTSFEPCEDGLYRILSANDEQKKAIVDRFVEIITTKPKNLVDPAITLKPTSFADLMATASKDSIEAWYNCSSRIDSADAANHGAEIKAQKKILCFDLDATLCPHRLPVPEANMAVLDTLVKLYDVVMVGAGNAPRIHRQMDNYPLDVVGNYGMENYRMIDGRFTIVQQLKFPADTAAFMEKCMSLREEHGYTEYVGEPLEFHASGMVTFGLLGTAPDPIAKLSFDPDRAKRRAFYPEVVSMFPDYNVFIGGSTSFDFVRTQFNKYDATLKYALLKGYTKDQVLFIGDDFDDGGGDSHIRLGGIDYIQIHDHNELPERMAFLY